MRAYELMIIFDGDLNEDAISSYLSNISAAVKAKMAKLCLQKIQSRGVDGSLVIESTINGKDFMLFLR